MNTLDHQAGAPAEIPAAAVEGEMPGWKFVPLEPTEEMLRAAAQTPGIRAIDDASRMHQLRGNPINKAAVSDGSPLLQAWRAMLAAAPAGAGISAYGMGFSDGRRLRERRLATYAELQAKIDALMLEYCPEDMTPEQFENWENNQVVGRASGADDLLRQLKANDDRIDNLSRSIDEQIATLGTRDHATLDPVRYARAQRAVEALAIRTKDAPPAHPIPEPTAAAPVSPLALQPNEKDRTS